MATKVDARLLASGTMRKWRVEVGNIVEELDLIFVEQQASRNGVDRRVSPALIEEAAVMVEGLEEVDISWASQPLQASNLEVGPLRTLATNFVIENPGLLQSGNGCKFHRHHY